jgi:para-nitrobenzyl esterase
MRSGSNVANRASLVAALPTPDAATARTLYDPRSAQTLDELKHQVFADKTMAEPARHLASEMTRAGQPVWLYRFSYVPESQRATVKGTRGSTSGSGYGAEASDGQTERRTPVSSV